MEQDPDGWGEFPWAERGVRTPGVSLGGEEGGAGRLEGREACWGGGSW